jgi:hypothetical protein
MTYPGTRPGASAGKPSFCAGVNAAFRCRRATGAAAVVRSLVVVAVA